MICSLAPVYVYRFRGAFVLPDYACGLQAHFRIKFKLMGSQLFCIVVHSFCDGMELQFSCILRIVIDSDMQNYGMELNLRFSDSYVII